MVYLPSKPETAARTYVRPSERFEGYGNLWKDTRTQKDNFDVFGGPVKPKIDG
jgi:hypothetical protein